MGGYTSQLRRCIPGEGVGETGVGWSSSSWSKSRIHFESPLVGKAGWKDLAKSDLSDFASMEKYTQPLLIECIRQSKK